METVPLAIQAMRFLVAIVFVAASVAKLGRRGEFEQAARNYRLLPPAVSGVVGVWLPRCELAAGLLLLLGIATPLVAGGLAVLLTAFAAAVAVNLVRGVEMDCGCFGASVPRRITWVTLARNVVLTGMAIAIALRPPLALSLWPIRSATASTGAATTDALAMFLAAALILAVLAVITEAVGVTRAAARLDVESTAGGRSG